MLAVTVIVLVDGPAAEADVCSGGLSKRRAELAMQEERIGRDMNYIVPARMYTLAQATKYNFRYNSSALTSSLPT